MVMVIVVVVVSFATELFSFSFSAMPNGNHFGWKVTNDVTTRGPKGGLWRGKRVKLSTPFGKRAPAPPTIL
uniref:Putative secreted protein n=1 Tax=Anopheles darlingi TaxID=43151 RepID=A0A2M4DEU0_ANODA